MQTKKNFSDRFVALFRAVLPAPFTIAIILTLFTVLMSLTFAEKAEGPIMDRLAQVADWWDTGLWNGPLMVFAMQAMLMLVLGHVLALTKPVDRFIGYFTASFCKNTASSAFVVTLLTVCTAWFNWGLGLIFGAIFARKVAEHAVAQKININYPLIGAAGYSGLMVWHGGFSGSATSKVAESGHLNDLMADVLTAEELTTLPDKIMYDQTVFGTMNITVTFMLIIILPLFMWFLGKRVRSAPVELSRIQSAPISSEAITGAERLDYSKILGTSIGVLVIIVAVYKAVTHPDASRLGFMVPNWINLLLFGLGLTLHRRFSSFMKGVDQAIGGAAGILIQFPLYFGIMGLMTSSGLVGQIAQLFEEISNETTYPIYTFMSSGIVNIFVPSGGSQWAVQGAIIVDAAREIGVPLNKAIMAMAYGDQLTNMLQPFWALPLLGITGLKAREILPYTMLLMLVGAVIFIAGLLLF